MLARLAQPERLRLERQRLERVAAQLSTPLGDRLSEKHRAQTLQTLADLFGRIEGRLKVLLVPSLLPLGAAGRAAAAAMPADGCVWRAVEAIVLKPPLDLLDAALARVAENDLVATVWSPTVSDAELAQRLVSLELAEAARLDEFGEPRLALGELQDEQVARAAWFAAAALRDVLLAAHPLDESEFDNVLETTVRRLLAEPGEGNVARAAAAVVRRLATLGLVDDDLIGALAHARQVVLVVAIVAHRAAMAAAPVRKLLLSSDKRPWTLLVEALGVSEAAAASLTAMSHGLGESDPRSSDRSAPHTLADARRQLARWRRDPRLVEAIESLAETQ